MRALAHLLKALSDETRLRMLVLLVDHGELCVCDFEGVLGISQSASSRHLRKLYQEGLVDPRREAMWVYYRLHDDLGPERAALVDAVGALVEPAERAALRDALRDWLARKQASGACPQP